MKTDEDSMTGMTGHFVVSKKVFSDIFHPFGRMLPFDFNLTYTTTSVGVLGMGASATNQLTLWLIGPDACRLTLQTKLRLCHETTNVRTCR